MSRLTITLWCASWPSPMSSTRVCRLTSARSAAPSLILACGDLPFEYLGYLMNALDVPLVFVPGNHDPDLSGYRVSRAGLTLRAGLPARPPWPDGAVSADGRVVDVAGLRIAGLGGCRRYRRGPNQYSDRQQAPAGLAAGRPGPADGRVDVLLTHAPPRGVGDGERSGAPGLSGPQCSRGPAAAGPAAARARGPRPGQPRATRLGRTLVRNATGWQLLDLEPVTGQVTDVTSHHSASHHSAGHHSAGHRSAGHRAAHAASTMPADTGFPRADVENDFLRARRRQVLARLAQRLRREPDDVNLILPFDEVVAALGRRGERTARPADDPAGHRGGHGRLHAGTSTAGSGPPPAGSGSGGSGSPWPSAAASRSRPSTCTGSATCTSSRTAITGSRSRWPPGRRRSTPM